MNNFKSIILSNHGRILYFLADNPASTIQKIAQETDLSVAGVQKIIANLEQNNYIVRTKIGRGYRYQVKHIEEVLIPQPK